MSGIDIDIKKKLKEAENKLKEAENKLNEAKDKLEDAKNEADKIINGAKDSAKDEIDKIIDSAKGEANNLIKDANDSAAKIIDSAKDEANNLINNAKKEVKSTADELARNIAEEASKYLGDIKEISELKTLADNLQEELKKLKEMSDIDKVLEKMINKGEELGENYLKTKLTPIEDLGFAVEPDLELNLENKRSLKLELFIYCIYKDLGQVDDRSKSHLILSVNLVYDILQPLNIRKTLESVKFDIKFNEDSIKQAVEARIQSEQEKLLESFIKEFFSEYLNIFDALKKILSL